MEISQDVPTTSEHMTRSTKDVFMNAILNKCCQYVQFDSNTNDDGWDAGRVFGTWEAWAGTWGLGNVGKGTWGHARHDIADMF